MNYISSFLKIQNQLRIFHWQTPKYAEHKAFGKAYSELDDLIDAFIEVYTGRHGMPSVEMLFKIELNSYNEGVNTTIESFIAFLAGLSNEIEETDTDLLNIRDEMLAVLNRLKYLLSLN